ncbi:arsenate reductase family protein [Streptococcus cuniculipharyngis]|uniref:Arsenate reductase family protein n=1 Tax=Streptococcus cuniculipharyngis TaxID=1562651 RepID=A0A5C5S9E4_9STRE|nr:arsenate reductase family protein [Streptococcus cuniculipharyngis]TWS96640.1 arsenate reductase family protein [Streptococcus cuniculipharyngis]
MLTFYEYPKCSTCRSAKKELEELGVAFVAIDIKANPPQVSQLQAWLANQDFPVKKLFNTSGNSYRQLGLKDRFDSLSQEELLAHLAEDGMLIKRPILADGDQILQVGYRTPYSNLTLK